MICSIGERPRRPRILYVITRAERGGAQTHVLRLACSMREHFEVAVATGEKGFLSEACVERGIPVYIVPHLQREIRPILDARAFAEIRKLIKDIGPDLIHAHTFKAGFLGRFAAWTSGIPSIYTLHTWLFGTAAMPRLWSILGGPSECLAAMWCDRVITVSEHGLRIARMHRIGPGTKIVTIHNGVPDCPERAVIRDHKDLVITMVARFSEEKDQDALLQAFAALRPGPVLQFVGEGPRELQSIQLARKLAVQQRVTFLGNRSDVSSLLAASDVFVLASKFEMLPISVLEAMRAGLPIVASNVGGVPELIEDGVSGLLTPCGSVSALTDALQRVTSDFKLRQRLGHSARQRFMERFVSTRQEERTRALYREVLLRSGTPNLEPANRTKAAA
jgi:glycosyltransferase involved in cell wall biosynthesis